MNGLIMKYFVLKPKGHSPYSEASRMAMLAYAEAIENENLQLAVELRGWVEKEKLEGFRKKKEGCGCGYCSR